MAQQPQLQSQGVQSQQSMGQFGQQSQMGTQGQIGQPGMRLQPQQRAALDSITRAIEVCEWCADQCIQEANPHMIECIRLCEDVSEFGEAALVLATRNSRFAQPHLQTFQQVLQACAQECGQHPHGHCQECASVLGQTINAVQSLVQPTGQQMQQMQQLGQ